MRIGIVIWKLLEGGGGLEKVGVDLANEMTRRGHTLTIFYNNKPAKLPHPLPAVDASVTLKSLGIQAYKATGMKGVLQIEEARQVIVDSGIDVLVAMFSWDVLQVFPCILNGTGIPLLISEHNNPVIINSERWNSLERHACLAAADIIHVLLPQYREQLPEFLHDRTTCIPNPAHMRKESPKNEKDISDKDFTDRKILLSAGRFNDSHKQFSLLIKSFSLLTSEFPDWDLVICGVGKDKESCIELVKKLKIRNRVRFPGQVSDMAHYYQNSQIFCNSSRHEGFPLVLLEAQAHSLPCVGFEECSGTNTVIIHGENGLLAQDMTAECLALKLSTLMQDSALRSRMGEAAVKSLARFAPDVIYDQWELLLSQASEHQGNTRLQKLFSTDSQQQFIEGHLIDILLRATPYENLYQKSISELSNRILKLEKSIQNK